MKHASESVAERYLQAVEETLARLVALPDLGRRRAFQPPALRDIRSFCLVAPFGVHLLFYRSSATELFAERLLYGGRDLPRRLLDPPGAED